MDRRTCWIAGMAVVLHAGAGAASLLVMPEGTPAMEPSADARRAYIDEHRAAWRAAWAAWALAGLSFVALLLRLAPTPAVWVLSALAVSADLASQALLAWVLPGAEPEAQAVWEMLGWSGAAVVANLGYTAAGLVAVVQAHRAGRIARTTAWLSAPVWVGGVGVAAFHLAGWDAALVAATALLTAAVTAWAAWVGVQACRS